ncbi:uncharacterized protein VP01_388g3 [Puccinia sorghi]|uniref:Uncharacterized protein n=1 Tax=Puccinia sorghi TaxID=27349 RepID=A0A0L6UUQ8_9BASI|nr:uncharacterized protein VP01_388g3 [Puccinia sorghi]
MPSAAAISETHSYCLYISSTTRRSQTNPSKYSQSEKSLKIFKYQSLHQIPLHLLGKIPRLIKKLPSYIQDHLQKVLDTDSDRHCGFQAVSYCVKLGKFQYNFMEVHHKLLDEWNTFGKCYVNKFSQKNHVVEAFGCACPPWVNLSLILFKIPLFSSRTQRSSYFPFTYSFERLEAICLSRSFKVGRKNMPTALK